MHVKAAVVLQKLASQVAKENDAKKKMREEESIAAEISLSKILGSLKSLADFKNLHENKVKLLKKLPIDAEEVLKLEMKMA